MADNTDIAWVAGLLEGEGCFQCRKRGHAPLIQLVMMDKDIVIRCAEIMGAHKVVQCKQDGRGGKTLYRMNLYSSRAMEWMMTIYVLMGARRQEIIRDCIDAWLHNTKRPYSNRRPYSRGAKIVWSAA